MNARIVLMGVMTATSMGAVAKPLQCVAPADELMQTATSYEARVVGKGRAPLLSAPNVHCATKQFLIPTDYVVVLGHYQHWMYISFVQKSGDTIEAWLPEKRVHIIKSFGQ